MNAAIAHCVIGAKSSSERASGANPPSGIVVNTNNRITDADFPDHLSFDWGDTYRVIRAGKLLGDRRYHTRDSFVEIQTDTVSEAARVLLPLVARDLWYAGEPAAEGTPERRRQVALERLAAWNGAMSEHTSSWHLGGDGVWTRHSTDDSGRPLDDLQVARIQRTTHRSRSTRTAKRR